MRKPSGIATLSALILAVSLFAASDVQAGSALFTPAKTTGTSLTATVVMDVTPGFAGETSIRVQKASQSAATIFNSSYVGSMLWAQGCLKPGFSGLQQSTAFRFTGYIDLLIGDPAVLNSLFSKFAPAGFNAFNAAIVDQDYVTCTPVGNRQVLSFTATIQWGTGQQ
jgi:hypothetical protein